jgi:hypothetical protein
MNHQFLGYVTLDDFEPAPTVGLACLWYADPQPQSDAVGRGYWTRYKSSGPITPAPNVPKPFRSMTCTVRRDTTKLSWAGPPQLELGPLCGSDLGKYASEISRKAPGLGDQLLVNYTPRLGVFIAGGQITVRMFRIAPV